VADLRENRNRSRVLVGKLERKRPFGRHRYRQEDNIKKILNKKNGSRQDSSDSGQGQVADSCE
jgi:hypothetical protein